MFDDLGEVARHLQRIGAKLDPPNDPEMANILEQYGVVNKQIGLLLIKNSIKFFHREGK